MKYDQHNQRMEICGGTGGEAPSRLAKSWRKR